METTVKDGQAKPEPGNATSFNWWIFTLRELGEERAKRRNMKLSEKEIRDINRLEENM